MELIRDAKLIPEGRISELLLEANELTAIFTAGGAARVALKPQTSNLKHYHHEYWFCWSGADGREHGAPFEGPWFSRYCGLRHESRAATALASELSCAAAQHLSDVSAESDVIFTVVTDDNAMRQIFAGPGDNLLVNASGKFFVNCATISPEVHVEIEKLAEKAGAQSLEACMASSITQAREGTLYLMCGGKAEAFRKAEPILEKLAAQIRLHRQSR